MSAIIITGNPVDGFTYEGPFDTEQDAIAVKESEGRADADWWVAPLETPTRTQYDPLGVFRPADDHHETLWTITGDLREIIDLDDESTNYAVEASIRDRMSVYVGVEFDSEYSCFFAYAPTEITAEAVRNAALVAARSL